MLGSPKPRRPQGSIRRRGNSLQVRLYAGVDPLTGRDFYLTESTTDEAEARGILNRFRAQVDQQRSARTRATFRLALEEWLKVQELEATTRDGYETYIRRYIPRARCRGGLEDLATRARAVLRRAAPLPNSTTASRASMSAG